jgi:hypothetical protein
VLRAAVPDIAPPALEAYTNTIRRNFPGEWDPISFCVGSRAEYHLCSIFHVEPGSFTPAQEGKWVAFQARDEGLQIEGEEPVAKWTFLLQSRSDFAASTLKTQISVSRGDVVSMDADLTGRDVVSIVALNPARWETAGLSDVEVLQLAQSRNVTLQLSHKEGPRLTFRVT